jgi:hypothetical protein
MLQVRGADGLGQAGNDCVVSSGWILDAFESRDDRFSL